MSLPLFAILLIEALLVSGKNEVDFEPDIYALSEEMFGKKLGKLASDVAEAKKNPVAKKSFAHYAKNEDATLFINLVFDSLNKRNEEELTDDEASESIAKYLDCLTPKDQDDLIQRYPSLKGKRKPHEKQEHHMAPRSFVEGTVPKTSQEVRELKAATENFAVEKDLTNALKHKTEVFLKTTPTPNTEVKKMEATPGSVVIKKTPADDGSFGNVYIYLNLVKDLSTKVKRAEEMKENTPRRPNS
uniref:Uncharacterized protein n=1 Tax=Haemonchus contortus TaxID=6289 RepID=A0A7I4Y2S1_HAECO